MIEQLQHESAEMAEFRRDLHRHPETAFEEHRTADQVASRLEAWGLTTHRGVGRTGIVASLSNGGSGRAVALRADMDALPIDELNTFDHRSRHPGRMHACGHDGHTTMLLYAARHLVRSRSFDGTVHFIFQPAEEHEGGAPAMIADGLFERFPCDAVFGMHNWPALPAGRFGLRPGPMMASSDSFEITLSGRGAHAAMPHSGTDVILAGSHLVQALQAIVARNCNPLDPAVVTVTQFHAGDAWNVIPETAVLRGTVRAFRVETQDLVERRIEEIARHVAAAFGMEANVAYARGYPALNNSERETAVCAEVLAGLVGAEAVDTAVEPSMGAEDFAYMLRAKPGCYVFIGNGAGEGGLHNPRYDFNDGILALGASYWVRLVERLLAKD